MLKREVGERVKFLYFLRDPLRFWAPVWELFALLLQRTEAVPRMPDVARPERLLDFPDIVKSVITLEEIVWTKRPAKALASALNMLLIARLKQYAITTPGALSSRSCMQTAREADTRRAREAWEESSHSEEHPGRLSYGQVRVEREAGADTVHRHPSSCEHGAYAPPRRVHPSWAFDKKETRAAGQSCVSAELALRSVSRCHGCVNAPQSSCSSFCDIISLPLRQKARVDATAPASSFLTS